MSYPNTVANLPGVAGTDWDYLYRPAAQLNGDGSGWEAMIPFKVTWGNLTAFAAAVAGTAQTVTTGWGSMARIMPLQHPLYPGLYARSLRSDGCGTPGPATMSGGVAVPDLSVLWSHAKLEVVFANPTYPVTGDQAYMTLEKRLSGTYSAPQGRRFAFPSGEAIDQNAGFHAAQSSYALTIYQASNPNNSATDDLVSHVNAATFLGWPAGQVRFDGTAETLSVSMAGVIMYTRQLLFTYQTYPWNQVYRRDGVLDTPVDPSGNPIYPSGDFYQLLS